MWGSTNQDLSYITVTFQITCHRMYRWLWLGTPHVPFHPCHVDHSSSHCSESDSLASMLPAAFSLGHSQPLSFLYQPGLFWAEGLKISLLWSDLNGLLDRQCFGWNIEHCHLCMMNPGYWRYLPPALVQLLKIKIV